MARMYPQEPRSDTKSNAERRFFQIIRSGLDDDWIVLHSLGLVNHRGKPWAEIDFVLIGSPGIFCLEIKGGRILRKEGRYHFIDGDDNVSIKDEGPFEQVGTATAALRQFLVGKVPTVRECVVGYGVVTPDIVFGITGPDVEPDVLYDLRDRDRLFSSYIERLVGYWHERISAQHYSDPITLSGKVREAVLDVLRGDFDLRPSLKSRLGEVDEKLIRLTTEQYRLLDALRENPRVLVRGGAGTGKTLMAVEEAKRRAGAGEHVLLCSYNKNLATHLRSLLSAFPTIDIYHLHGLMSHTIRSAGLSNRIPAGDEQAIFREKYPEVFLDALLTLDHLHEYDAVLVDEAQDLLCPEYLEVFDVLVNGGLADGIWRLFYDPYQNIYNGTSADCLQTIISHHPAQFRLTMNCRNTKPIAITTQMLSGVDWDETLVTDGPEVEMTFYRSDRQQCLEISRCINRLLSDGITPKRIAVLSKNRRVNSCLANGLVDVPYDLSEVEGAGIFFSTVWSFKGLEADAVLFIDIDELMEDELLLYVGCSRAKAYLSLYFDEKVRDQYRQKAYEYGKRLSAGL